LRVKEQARKQQEFVVLQCKSSLRASERNLERVEAELKNAADYVAERMRTGHHDATVWAGLSCGRQMESVLKQARQEVSRALVEYENARSQYRQQSTQVEALKLLQQQDRSLHRKQSRNQAQMQLDDMAMTQWSRTRRNDREPSDA